MTIKACPKCGWKAVTPRERFMFRLYGCPKYCFSRMLQK